MLHRHSRLVAAGALAAGLAMFPTLPPAAAAEPIRIGAPLSLTGSLADEGAKEQHGLDMCIDTVNQNGGVKVGAETRKLEAVKYDYQSETNKAIQIVQRLVTVDKVDFLFAPYGSGDSKAASVVAERYDIPMIASAASTVSVYDANIKNLFGTLFPTPEITEAEATYYKAKVPGAKKIALLALNTLFTKGIALAAKDSAVKRGFEVVFDGLYSPGTLDFSTVLTQIKAANPDWIYATGYIQELILVRRQMAGLGVKAPIITMTAGAAYPEFIQNLGPLADNVTTNAWWHPSATYTDAYLFGSNEAYVTAFRAKYKTEPTYLEASATAACEVLMQSVEAAGSTAPAAVRKIMNERRFETFYGPIKFGPHGQNEIASPMVLQIQKGKYIVLDPKEIRTGDLAVGVGGT